MSRDGRAGPAAEVKHRLYPLLLVAATLAAFCNVFDNAFHLDDFYRVVDNPGIQSIQPIWRHFIDPRTMSTLDRITEYRPFLPLTLSLNFWWSGSRVAGYHAFNLLAHLAAALLLYGFLLELMRSGRRDDDAAPGWERDVAFLAALLFAVHPVSGIVVNYISARDLGMMEALLAGTLLAYTRMRRLGDSARRWAGVLLLFACSLLAKTNGIVIPLLVLAFERLIVAREAPWRAAIARSAAFAGVVAVYFSWTKFGLHFSAVQQVLSESGALSITYPLTQLWVHLIYLANAVWPFAIREMPAVAPAAGVLDWRVVAGAVFVAASGGMAWRLRRTQPIVSFAIVAYWLFLLPESSILPLYHLRNDYRPYPSSPFLFLIVILAASRVLKPRAVMVAAVAATFYLAGASLVLNRTWLTDESLWTQSVRYGGDEVAHVNLARAIADHRDPRVKANLEEALRISPQYVIGHINYGLVLIELGDQQAGLAHCEEAVRLAPTWAQSHAWLAVAYERLGRLDAAAAESLRAAQLDPRDLRQQYTAAALLQRVGRYPDSVPLLTALSERVLDYGLTDFFLAFAYQQAGDLERAIPVYRRFLSGHPDHAQAHFNLGLALMARGDDRGAVGEFNRTVVLQPDYREVHRHLAACYERIGDGVRAAEERRLYGS
jgi:Flp pilus assembly protein TadD